MSRNWEIARHSCDSRCEGFVQFANRIETQPSFAISFSFNKKKHLLGKCTLGKRGKVKKIAEDEEATTESKRKKKSTNKQTNKMQRGCSPSLDDKRRDLVISKIVAVVAKRVGDMGVLLDKADFESLTAAVHELYNAAQLDNTTVLSTSGRISVSPGKMLPRPQSAAASLVSSLSVATKSVSQAQIDQLVTQFASQRKAIVASIVTDAESKAKKGLPPRPSTASGATTNTGVSGAPPPQRAPPLPLPGANVAEPPSVAQLDPRLFLTADQLRAVGVSPPVLEGPVFAESPFRSTSSMQSPSYLQRSLSSMQASTNSILHLMGTDDVPASKRHRKILRDADAYQAAVQAKEEAERDKRRYRELQLQRQQQLREGLDSQCQEHHELERRRNQQRQADREACNQAAVEYQSSQRELRALKRAVLAKQLRLNEQMRADRLQMAVNEKKAHNEDDFEDLQYINESSKEQLELDKMRRECQQNTLALQMQAIEEGKRSASAMKIQELRQAKLYQAQLNEQLDQQEQKRRDQRATVQKKVQAGEARAMRQYAMVEGAVSADEKKARWLQQRLDRDVEQLDRQAEVRASTQQARKKKANSEMLTVLQKQIFHRQHQKLLEKHQSAELAQEIQNGLDLMIMHDAELHQQNTEEKQEWLHVLDAQRKVKSFKETKDVETCIPRTDVLTRSISSLQASPTRCATSLW